MKHVQAQTVQLLCHGWKVPARQSHAAQVRAWSQLVPLSTLAVVPCMLHACQTLDA